MRKILLTILLLSATGVAQVADKANSQYKTQEGRARVAQSLISPDRDSKQKPQELVDAMALRPGMVVADIGTGAGYMLPYLSRAVGSGGRVLAEDIQDDFLSKAKAHADDDKLGNISYVKGTEKDPNLPGEGVDVALALDSYHHYDYPERMLAGIHKALRADGRFVVVEYYRRPSAMTGGRAMEHIRLDESEVIKEIEANGFKLVSRREHVKDSQYMLIFEKR